MKPFYSSLYNTLLAASAVLLSQSAYALDLDKYPRLQASVAPLISKGVYTEQELKAVFSRITLRE